MCRSSFFCCVYLKSYKFIISQVMKTIYKILIYILLGLAVICSAWLFEANDERLIVLIIGAIIMFGGGTLYAVKMLFEQ